VFLRVLACASVQVCVQVCVRASAAGVRSHACIVSRSCMGRLHMKQSPCTHAGTARLHGVRARATSRALAAVAVATTRSQQHSVSPEARSAAATVSPPAQRQPAARHVTRGGAHATTGTPPVPAGAAMRRSLQPSTTLPTAARVCDARAGDEE
jgi:hypothetical protein